MIIFLQKVTQNVITQNVIVFSVGLYSMLGGEEHSIGDAAFYPEIDFDYFSADI